MEVIHEGVLEIGVKPDSKSSKDWKTRLFVLKKHHLSDRATLDYYKNTNKRWQKQSIKGVLSLWPQFEISIAHLCSYKFTLKLTTTEHTVYLAAASPAAMNKWYYMIQTQQILTPTDEMYIFNVQTRDSDSMNLIGANGDCQLVLTSEYQVKISNLPKKEVLCIWPFDCLKTFSYGNGLFSFTAGRHAPHGPGDFSFITSQDKLIHHTLQKLIDKAKRNSTASSASSSFLSISDRPPAKLPLFNHHGGGGESNSDTPTSSSDENMPPPPEYTVAREFPSRQPPPLPDQPPPRIPPKPSNINTNTDSSDNKRWLHERYGNSIEKGCNEYSSADQDEDHVYSHTLHRGCTQGGNKQVEDDPAIYNALVHQGQSSKKTGGQNYDIAYPKAKTQSIKGGTDTYSFIEQDKTDPAPLPLSPPPPLPLSPEGMTANPLYGSSGNLLEAIEANPLPPNTTPADQSANVNSITKPLPPNEIINQPLPPNELINQPLPPKELINTPLPDVSPTTNTRPDVTANPTYVTTQINSNDPLSKCNNNASVNNASTTCNNEMSTIQQDTNATKTTGYTKINKPAAVSGIIDHEEGEFVPSSVGSDPPPIPSREYSLSDLEQFSPPNS